MTATHTRQHTAYQGDAPWNENNAIVARIQEGDADAYQDLWNANKRLVAHYAHCYFPLIERRACIDFEDLMQSGYIGLHVAAERFDLERGASFSTYAAYYIKHEMRRAVGIVGKRNPADTALSLDGPLTLNNGDNRTLGDTLAAVDETGSLGAEELRGTVRTALMRMVDDVIRCIMWERYWNKKTAAQTADKYGIPVEEMRGLIKRGYALLRGDDALQEWAIDHGCAS